jgi:hypothetical protein
MAAALAAAVSGASVHLVEAAPACGRSILASGNGRCNFCNADLDPGRYNDPAFVAAVMGERPLDAVLDLFGSLGLWYVTEDEGRMYPRSRAARSVLDVLEGGLDSYGVERTLGEKVVEVARGAAGGWEACAESGARFGCDALVWAAGGGSGDAVADAAGTRLTPLRPALCPLATNPRPPKAIDGVRVECAVELCGGRSVVERAAGEVLFRTYGLSGIVVFDLSRLARAGDRLVLDLVPDVDEDRLADLLAERLRRLGERPAPLGRAALLDGAVHPKLAAWLLGPGGPGADGDPARLAGLLKRWEFTVEGPGDERQAQVVQGGLPNDAFDPLTLEARRAPGLFACGEALDVDGACGGFNLAWAWVSGLVAGRAAARAAAVRTRHPGRTTIC